MRVPVGWVVLIGLLFGVDGLVRRAGHGLVAVVAIAVAELAVYGVLGTAVAFALDRSLFQESRALFRGLG